MKPDLPLDLVADMDTLPILTTASHIRSYDQESLEDSLIGNSNYWFKISPLDFICPAFLFFF